MTRLTNIVQVVFYALLLSVVLGSCAVDSYNSAETLDISTSDSLEMCIDSTVTQSRKDDGISVECEMRPIEMQLSLSAPTPGVSFAQIKCACHDDDGGNLICQTCTCQADDTSNCDSFVAWCEAHGDEGLGGGDIGICNQ